MLSTYIFDVDGVITSPVEKKIIEMDLIEILALKLQKNMPIAFISGRGLEWLKVQVVEVLEKYLDAHPQMDKKMLDNLYVSGEFGGVYALHRDGERVVRYNAEFSMPKVLRARLNKVAFQFADIGFVEHEKQIQFTIEAKKGKDYFKDGGDKIVEVLRKELKAYPDFAASYDRIGMNVKHKKANKRYAIKQYLDWMHEKGFSPHNFYVFGDSPSDLEMGDELFTQKKKVSFIFVGNKHDIADKEVQFPLAFTKEHCDKGTLEFLREQQT